MSLSGLMFLATVGLLSACGGDSPPAAPAASDASADAAAATTASAEAPATLEATDTTWTPEALEELLAPIALYPDPVLLQVLQAATNPQEVLDAGNWLVANPDLQANALDEAAKKIGFTAPIRGLIQSPEVIDKLCLNMNWTEELGQAFVNDQAGVMDAVQRLRAQAQDVGTLASSPQMTVETVSEGGVEAIEISPPSPQVVYVPQYDPVAAYAPPATAVAATSTTAVVTENKGHSTGALVTTGLLSFGAGLLVGEIFDDDDDDYYHGHNNNMWYGSPPYYPPYPYRPSYGGGYYPSNGYNRPNNYIRGGNTVIVNQNNSNNNYYKRYDNERNVAANRKSAKSPISSANRNRSDLSNLNAQSAKGPKRGAPAASDAWKGKSGYAGADPKNRESVQNRAATAKSPAKGLPKVQGNYAGAKPQRDTTPAARDKVADSRPSASQRPAAGRPDAGSRPNPGAKPETRAGSGAGAGAGAGARAQDIDRGRASSPSQRTPDKRTAAAPRNTSQTAVGARNSGQSERAASARGRQSAPKGVPARAKQGGGKPHKR